MSLLLGTLLYSYNRQQLITTISTRERLHRDRATTEVKCWDDMRRFNVTRKGAARSLRFYIAVCPQTQCNPSSYACNCSICYNNSIQQYTCSMCKQTNVSRSLLESFWVWILMTSVQAPLHDELWWPLVKYGVSHILPICHLNLG